MLEALVQNLVESLADVIAGTAVAIANDQQVRRDTLAEYRAGTHAHAQKLLQGLVDPIGPAVRNRYAEWLGHPRLGHEPLSAEVHAADVGLNEAAVALKKSPTLLNQALVLAACIRVTAITEVLGPQCIYLGSIKRATPVKAARSAKSAKASGDKRVNRRAIQIDDVPVEIWPLIAGLVSSNPSRSHILAELEAERGGNHDRNGIITKLTTLAALEEHRTFVDGLAVAAGGTLPAGDAVSRATDPEPVAPSATIADNVADIATPPQFAPLPGDPISTEAQVDITLVAGWCASNTWAVLEAHNVFTLKNLGKRRDINTAFDRVAQLPAMQEALRAIQAHRTTDGA